MADWDVWTDGSAIHDDLLRRGVKGQWRSPGGWAAVVEHGSDGYVLRGRHPATTNVRMELVAVIEGLKQVPTGDRVTLHFDCTVVYSVLDWIEWPSRPSHQITDGHLWLQLAFQLRRLEPNITFDLLGKGKHPIHQRAHGMAGAEAKAMAMALPLNAEPLGAVSKGDRRRMRRAQILAEENRRTRQPLPSSAVERSRMRDAFSEAGIEPEAEVA
jgi:ribonuclease HI